MTRPELDKDEVAAEVVRIHLEQGMSVPDPMQAGDLP
jgi:hypothetical protein